MRYLLLVFFAFLFQSGFAQSTHRLRIISHKKHSAAERSFVATCLGSNYDDDLLPSYAGLDTLKHIVALIRTEPAIKFNDKCEGIYYYLLRSEHWATPTFSGGYYSYQYLVILNDKVIAFKVNDAANAAKFQRVRQELTKRIGVQKTDSIRPHLVAGYAQL